MDFQQCPPAFPKMSVQFNPFPDPKRGKARAAMKRPAAAKDKEWSSVPYVRGAEDEAEPARADQCKWSRSISELLTSTTSDLVEILREDGLLPSWENKVCPRCEKGTLSPLRLDPAEPDEMPKHRCDRRGCQVYVNPHHLHPIFVEGRGSATSSLQQQAAMLLLLLNNVPHPAIHRLLHANHKSIEDMSRLLRDARTG